MLLANRTFLLEFLSLSNRVYQVQYSSNLVHWRAARPHLQGNGNWLQWIDNGQPKTDSLPATQASRFYRVILRP
jgi:hypothetical protein